MVIGSVALVVTLIGTSALILAINNIFTGSADQETNPYNSLPVSKIVMQAVGFDGKDFSKCATNQATIARADALINQGTQMAHDRDYRGAIDCFAESVECLKRYPGLDCIQAVVALTEKAKCEDQLGLKAEREKTLRTLQRSPPESSPSSGKSGRCIVRSKSSPRSTATT